MQLQTLAKHLHIPCQQDVPITNITIDSRQVGPGSLFIALKGQNLDGHAFAQDAQRRGAAAILCAHAIGGLAIPELVVSDPIEALGKIANLHRQGFSIPIIAITGSNGKTSVKEMIYAILPKPALATQGNLNNHLGVPLTLLKLQATHQYAVFELGANHVGEIQYTANLVHPHIALVNNIAPAHIGEFGSIEHIAQTKGEIYAALPAAGIAIVNKDDAFAHHWDALIAPRQCLRFSRLKKADIYAKDICFNTSGCASLILCTPDWEEAISLSLPGLHHVNNALAATACCFAAGIHAKDIIHGLTTFQGVKGRQTFLKGRADTTIIDDTYNANLHSVLAAIDLLAARQGRRILVLGDMGELGPYAREHHQQVGLTAKEKGLDLIFTYGHHTQETSKSFGPQAQHCQSKDELIKLITPLLDVNTTILVKGSRAAAMEDIVASLLPSTS
ncbi:MAG: UDP-N-acetylmuramoyl-tripeptide--D-alanyl-D-alanine ligase [Gammaproteobacteria bacterium]|nr:UDP-N-acetylmuramoyl-tripeptide--D-alanyl-D-alanine ligase [Gammaproteobacteria bacterium]